MAVALAGRAPRPDLSSRGLVAEVAEPLDVSSRLGRVPFGPQRSAYAAARHARNADVIATPQAEVYTRPGHTGLVTRYYGADDLAELERQPPFSGFTTARR